MPYNVWLAISYELSNLLIEVDPRWEFHPLIKKLRSHCFPDWVLWKTERTMANVDRQTVELQKQMEVLDHIKYIKPIIIQHAPDTSKAQELLGGTIEIKAPWYNKENNSNK